MQCASLEAEKAVVLAHIETVVLEVGGLICSARVMTTVMWAIKGVIPVFRLINI